MQICLMLGAGHKPPHRQFAAPTSASQEETKWVTLDFCEAANPDVLFDLEWLEDWKNSYELPFPPDYFDEIHAYEVLEHFGRQGDFRGLFSTFRQLWRVIKPGGYLIGSCPALHSEWLWGDPGHTRVISSGTLVFLTKEHYEQLGKTASSDYREFVDPYWWEIVHADNVEDRFIFALKKS